MPHALIVDDDENFTSALAEFMELEGFTAATARTLEEARTRIRGFPLDVLLVDLMLPDGSGIDLIHEIDPTLATRIIVITGHPSIDTAIQSLRARVFDFLVKPIDIEHLKACIRALVSHPTAAGAGFVGSAADRQKVKMFCDLVGDSPAMRELYKMIEKVAPTDATVFLQGESGTGKELVAHAIHQLSPRCQRRYLAVNCGAISPTLIGSELFGHERGSFTGANRQHKGHFERTAGGTLFLDEITEMPTDLQVQLLRVLETGKLLRLGGDHEVPVDVRVIAATNRSPEEVVAEGKLRKDLYFRLMVFPLYIPPLREREGDVTLLAQYFLGLLNHQYSLEKHFTKAVLQSLEERPWQGNVRELRNAIQRAFILADREIGADHFATGDLSEEEEEEEDPLNLSVGTSIDDAEKRLIFATLEHYGGDKTRTAEALGISLKTLYNRLKKYEVDWDH